MSAPAADREAPRILPLSLTADDELHLMLALIQYREVCRGDHVVCPPMVDRVVAQVSRRVTRGQECSTFDMGLPSAEHRSVENLLVTYSDAALMLAWSVSTLRRRVREGLLTPVRHGRAVRLRRTDLEHLIEGEIS